MSDKILEELLQMIAIMVHSRMCPECKKKYDEIWKHIKETEKNLR